MRIVGGRWAGTDLVSPAGRVRPTGEDLRVRWVELLAPHLEGARILELYAGTGAVGLEALSRGAASVDFVENNPAALHSLKANVARLRVTRRTRIFKHDALRWVHRLNPGTYDLALADPPYGSGQSERLVEDWIQSPYSATLSLEHASDHDLPAGGRGHEFGDRRVTIYEASEVAEPGADGGAWEAEARELRERPPRHLLFLCVANSARSQMAEAIARSLAPRHVRISSAGSEPTSVRPEAVAVLAEIGIDASRQSSKGMAAVQGENVDTVITLCAEEVCPMWLGTARRMHWPLPDPAAVEAGEPRLQAFRRVRDELGRRLSTIFGG